MTLSVPKSRPDPSSFYSEGCSGIIASRDVGLDTTAASTQSEDYACLIHFLIQI